MTASGQIKPGDRLPSEHELVAQFGISRMTVNRALRELVDQGRIVRVGYELDPLTHTASVMVRSLASGQ